ncbi:unnamed protein product [Ambrosiozyma monospora]|uniref:Unnamed protein product n=1 Tax=Ambrosiozyma monospora TaxID=43982 RepID=A0A9W6YT51_AMBMO|nr:unnamed protein product [Ambrosiozyma monospora]
MSSPQLPLKPISNQTTGTSTPTQVAPPVTPINQISYDNLEYPLIPPTIAQEHLNFDSKPPAYVSELSTSKLQELLKDLGLLKGMIVSKNQESYKSLNDDVLAKLEKQIEFVTGLIKIHETELIPRSNSVNELLAKHSADLDNFNNLQVLMYDKLNNFSRNAISETLRQAVAASDKECEKLVIDLKSESKKLDNDRLSQFIESYRNQRQDYYLKKEKLARVSQERVGGLD